MNGWQHGGCGRSWSCWWIHADHVTHEHSRLIPLAIAVTEDVPSWLKAVVMHVAVAYCYGVMNKQMDSSHWRRSGWKLGSDGIRVSDGRDVSRPFCEHCNELVSSFVLMSWSAIFLVWGEILDDFVTRWKLKSVRKLVCRLWLTFWIWKCHIMPRKAELKKVACGERRRWKAFLRHCTWSLPGEKVLPHFLTWLTFVTWGSMQHRLHISRYMISKSNINGP